MDKFKIEWTEKANLLLSRRGHQANDLIKMEFAEKADTNLVRVDEASNLFVTPVANSRYSVVWRKEPDRKLVEAVVPAQFSPNKSGKLLKQVLSAVEHESNGYVILTP